MDYMDLMVEFDKVLRKAPLSTTHWNIQRDKFVRMGESVVDGYLNLDIILWSIKPWGLTQGYKRLT